MVPFIWVGNHPLPLDSAYVGNGEIRSEYGNGVPRMMVSLKDRVGALWQRLSASLRRSLQPAAAPVAHEDGPLTSWNPASRAYFQRWLVIGALIGIVAGVGSIVFYVAIALCTHLFLGLGAGFVPPGPAGEGATVIHPIARPWLIPVITTLGGLLCGLIVYTFAPEAEGHGTDAAIEAFHHHGGKIRARIPPIKLLASAITIGSGGSAGREGPTAQIAAGFGSWLGDVLHLNEHDRRIAMATGVGAGIGSIFKAPFGGALLSGEILYKRDFETEALFPAFIASVVGFSIYCLWAGWTPSSVVVATSVSPTLRACWVFSSWASCAVWWASSILGRSTVCATSFTRSIFPTI